MKRLAALLFPLLLSTTYAQAQTWALPATNQQNKDVLCTTCPVAVQNKLTVGYSGAIKGFVGRFVDSQSTLDRQAPLRTVRADGVLYAPQRNRVYVWAGSAIFGYDYSTFFSRLSSGNSIISAREVLSSGRVATTTESFLSFDNFFNAEYTGVGWVTPTQDGQERLYGFDYDDRDLVYLTTNAYFGWGIVRDDRTSGRSVMPSVTQVYPAGSPDISSLVVLKAGTQYYMLGSNGGARASQFYDVTVPTQPRRLGDYPHGFVRVARSSDLSRVAMLEPVKNANGALENVLVLHTAAGIANGSQPAGTFRAPLLPYTDVTSDGTNFYAVSTGQGFALVVTEFLYDAASGTYTVRTLTVGTDRMTPSTVTANAGYLVVTGTTADSATTVNAKDYGSDMKVLKIGADFSLSELPLEHYISKYYTNPPAPYVAPGPFIQLRSGIVLQQGANLYLGVNAHALGDVYLLEGTVEPPACLPLDAQHVLGDYRGTSAACSATSSSPSCYLDEAITFDAAAAAGYRFDCKTHSFKWTLPDGSVVNDRSFQRSFAVAGDYNVTLEVTAGTDHLTTSVPVHVKNERPPACGTLTRTNISYDFHNASSSCTPLGGQCGVGESIAFSVDTFANYQLGCGPHTFAWSLNGAVISQQQTFNRSFPTAGDYPMRLSVSNGTSSIDLDFVVHVGAIVQPPHCGTLSSSTVSYTWRNAANTCSALSGACPAGEAVSFDVESFNGYSFATCPHTYTWTIDGQTFNQKSFQKTFANPGQYSGALVISNGESTYQASFTVNVGPVIKQCGTMTRSNILVQYTGPTSGCSDAGSSCVNGESVAFKAADVHPGYDFSCAVHTYSWDFGDGSAPAGAGVAVAHSYPVPGDYKVSVRVQQGSTSFTTDTIVHVRSPNAVLPISTFDFSVTPYIVSGVRIPNGYVFTPFAEPAIDTVTWSWDFGDGTKAISSDYKGVVHIFADDADHTVTLLSPQSSQVRSHSLKLRRRPGR